MYEAECNVCANTVRIFEKADLEHISMVCLARAVNADPEELEALRDADCCNPHLVIRLCRRLGIREPETCSKLKKLERTPPGA